MNHIIKISFIKDVKVYLYRPDTSIMNIFTLSPGLHPCNIWSDTRSLMPLKTFEA